MFGVAEGCNYEIRDSSLDFLRRRRAGAWVIPQPSANPLSRVPIASLAIHQARAVLAVWQRTAPNTVTLAFDHPPSAPAHFGRAS